MRKITSGLTTSSLLFFLSASFVQAAGLEKSTSWSGRYAGIGGAAVSSVEGSESLYFNPANLATTQGIEVSGNFSGIFPQFSAPFTSSTSITGERGFKPSFGAFASYALTDKLVVGIGSYAAGGAKSKYSNLDLTGAGLPSSFSPVIQANLSLIEYSVGVGYKILDDLRIGIAWRILNAHATIGTLQAVATAGAPGYSVAGSTYDQLGATRFNGFRIGASYAPRNGRYGMGATWRSAVGVSTQGTSSGTIAGVTQPYTGSYTSVSNSLPYQITLGAHYEVIPAEWKAYLQYDFTNYMANREFGVQGTMRSPALLGGQQAFVSIPQFWNNLSVLRVGTEYLAMKELAVRLAYVFTSQTTPKEYPNPNYYAPGAGHTIIVGAGNRTWVRNMMLNAAIEYSFNQGEGRSSLSSATGTYKENDFAFHLGATYQL